MINPSELKISVVIPCYNVSKHIEEVVNKMPSEINHIIVVNDCSTDSTLSILEKIASNNSKFHVLSH